MKGILPIEEYLNNACKTQAGIKDSNNFRRKALNWKFDQRMKPNKTGTAWSYEKREP